MRAPETGGKIKRKDPTFMMQKTEMHLRKHHLKLQTIINVYEKDITSEVK